MKEREEGRREREKRGEAEERGERGCRGGRGHQQGGAESARAGYPSRRELEVSWPPLKRPSHSNSLYTNLK